MCRLQWKWTSAWTFVDENNEEHSFLELSPSAIGAKARMSYEATWQKQVSAKFGKPKQLPRPLHAEQLKKAAEDKEITDLQRGCLKAFLAKAVWTRDRLHQHKLVDTATCRFCLNADTIEHRVEGGRDSACGGQANA